MKQLITFFFCIFLFYAQSQPKVYPNLSLEQLLDSASLLQENLQLQKVKGLLQEASNRLDKDSPKELWYMYYETNGSNLFELRNIPEAKKSFENALSIAKQLEDSTRIGVAYTHIANAENISSNYKAAIELFEKGISYLTKNDEVKYNSTLMNMSNAYSGLNEFEKALSALVEAKNYFTRKEDLNKIGSIENNLGEIYRINIKDYKNARIHYRWAIDANEKANNLPGLAKNYHNLAASYLDENNADSAIFYLKKSINLKEEYGDEGAMASANYLLGSTYVKSGQYEKAIEYYNLSMEQCKRNGLEQGIFHNYISLGETYFGLKNYTKSEEMLLASLSIGEAAGQLSMLESVYTGLYEVNKAAEDYKDALHYLEKKQSVIDSIHQIQEKQNFAELRTHYETDLAEAENKFLREQEIVQNQKLSLQQKLLYISVSSIVLLLLVGMWVVKSLKQRNTAYRKEKESSDALAEQYQKLKKSEAELAESNDLKNKILSVLGHDLRSPLAGISSLLSTMSAAEITREELQDIVGHLKKEVDVSLTTLHEILAWARLQMNEMTKQTQKIDATELLNEVLSIYEPNIRAKLLDVQVDVTPKTELWADYNQMRSICGNLLSNAIKFTPSKGNITIAVKEEPDFTEITFCDSGLGIPENVLENLNNRGGLISNQGTSGESGTGIGLRIVTDFVDAHNGKLHFNNNTDVGTTVSVRIPTSKSANLKTA